MISPSSFPVIGAESIVNINLAKLLGESGEFEIDLVSKMSKWQSYPSEPIEHYGVKLRSLNIVEVDNKVNLRTILQTVGCFLKFGVFVKGGHWAYKAINVVKRLRRERDYDYVLTKNFPGLLLGCYLKKRYNMKWIASWNDPYPEIKYPYPYGKGADARGSITEQKLVKKMQQADVHIFPNERIQIYIQSYLHANKENCIVVPHTFFKRKKTRTYYNSDELKLVHAGNLGQYRNPEPFLRSLKSFITKYPTSKISITFIGTKAQQLTELSKKYNLEEVVTIIPSVEYTKCLEMLDDYDVAVLIEAPVKEGIFLPTKVGDFIGSEIPVYAISPSVGILNDMYKRNEIGYFSPCGNESEIENTLVDIYSDFKNRSLKLSPFDEEKLKERIISTYSKL